MSVSEKKNIVIAKENPAKTEIKRISFALAADVNKWFSSCENMVIWHIRVTKSDEGSDVICISYIEYPFRTNYKYLLDEVLSQEKENPDTELLRKMWEDNNPQRKCVQSIRVTGADSDEKAVGRMFVLSLPKESKNSDKSKQILDNGQQIC